MKYICPKCKNKYTGDNLKYCICGGKLQKDIDFEKIAKNMQEMGLDSLSKIFKD